MLLTEMWRGCFICCCGASAYYYRNPPTYARTLLPLVDSNEAQKIVTVVAQHPSNTMFKTKRISVMNPADTAMHRGGDQLPLLEGSPRLVLSF